MKEYEALVDELLATFDAHRGVVELFQNQLVAALMSSEHLSAHIHSMKARVKEPEHLREKLWRKIIECEQRDEEFTITSDNLLTRINDLAGVRLLHLYTRQIRVIDKALREILNEQTYDLLGTPFARTWDDEYRDFFKSCGFETQESPTMYTSVHYVVGSASRTTVTCEIQVRTLMEEVWGEVDHSINYPTPSTVLASTEQLKVLARVTSSATRLVDSIFLTHNPTADDV